MSRHRGGPPEFLIGLRRFRFLGLGSFFIFDLTGECCDPSIFFNE
jgi:hypothetical protein